MVTWYMGSLLVKIPTLIQQWKSLGVVPIMGPYVEVAGCFSSGATLQPALTEEPTSYGGTTMDKPTWAALSAIAGRTNHWVNLRFPTT